MARFRPFLIRFLAAVLLLQSGTALAHCWRGMAAGEGMLVEICSAEGMRTIRLDAQGEPAPEHTPQSGGAFCPLCHGLPDVPLPAPPGLAGPAWFPAVNLWRGEGAGHAHPPARAPPYSTRAPPITA